MGCLLAKFIFHDGHTEYHPVYSHHGELPIHWCVLVVRKEPVSFTETELANKIHCMLEKKYFSLIARQLHGLCYFEDLS